VAPALHGGVEVFQRLGITVGEFGVGGVQSAHGVGEHLDRLFEGLEVLGRQENSGRLAVHGLVDALVLATDLGDQSGQVRLGVRERERRHGQEHDQRSRSRPELGREDFRPAAPLAWLRPGGLALQPALRRPPSGYGPAWTNADVAPLSAADMARQGTATDCRPRAGGQGSQVQILSARQKKSQVRGRFRETESGLSRSVGRFDHPVDHH